VPDACGWVSQARDDYRAAAEVFQKNRNLQGAIFAAANAGLVLVQLGNEAEGVREVILRLPSSPVSHA
jgi:hypothetical protein